MWSTFQIGTVFVFTILILEGDTKRHNIRENAKPQPRDYRPSKWIANSAMDIWYGNKSSIDILSREFADIMYKLTARPVRSVPLSGSENNETKSHPQISLKRVSRVEINLIDTDNKTFHMIKLQPIQESVNNTVLKGLEPS